MTRSLDADDIGTLLARVRLGLIQSTDLPTVATGLLAAGQQSATLNQLAGLDLGLFDSRDAERLWTQGVAELGLELPSAESAALRLVCPIANSMLAGKRDPLSGARAIVAICEASRETTQLSADLVYPIEVWGYYANEADLSDIERESALAGLRNQILNAAGALQKVCPD